MNKNKKIVPVEVDNSAKVRAGKLRWKGVPKAERVRIATENGAKGGEVMKKMWAAIRAQKTKEEKQKIKAAKAKKSSK